MSTCFKIIATTLIATSFHSTHTMQNSQSSLASWWGSIVYHCTPASWTVQSQINSAIGFAKLVAKHSEETASAKSGEFKGISWSVISTKNKSNDFFIQVECSDPAIAKMYQDKAAQGLL